MQHVRVKNQSGVLEELQVAEANKLSKARTIQTNLGSSAAPSFDGSANVSPGVTGTLPVANGGTGQTDLSNVTVGNATSAEKVENALTVTVNGTETAYDGSSAQSVTVSASNPNLLDNSNFAINQGGKTSWSSVGQTVDRWRKTASTGTVTLTTGSNQSLPYQIRLTGGAGIAQYLERDFLRNKNYTITVGYAAGTGATNISERSYTFRVPDSSNQNYTEEIATDLYVTIYVKQYSSSLHSYIRISDDSSSGRYIYYIKLEEGDVATPYEIPDPATELLKCQRYYVKLTSNVQVCGSVGNGGNYGYVTLWLPAPMRTTTPTIVSYTAGSLRINGSNYSTVTDLSDGNMTGNALYMKYTSSGSYDNFQTVALELQGIELSAEIIS